MAPTRPCQKDEFSQEEIRELIEEIEEQRLQNSEAEMNMRYPKHGCTEFNGITMFSCLSNQIECNKAKETNATGIATNVYDVICC